MFYGYSAEVVQYKNIMFIVWDLGGQDKIRPIWKQYYTNTVAIIYVVDSNDKQRIDKAKYELWRMLAENELKNVKLLVFGM